MSLFDRLAGALAASADCGFTGEDERHIDPDGGTHTPAAVLIAVTDRPQPGVILTQRPDYLRSHPGQIAFPGARSILTTPMPWQPRCVRRTRNWGWPPTMSG